MISFSHSKEKDSVDPTFTYQPSRIKIDIQINKYPGQYICKEEK